MLSLVLCCCVRGTLCVWLCIALGSVLCCCAWSACVLWLYIVLAALQHMCGRCTVARLQLTITHAVYCTQHNAHPQ